MGASNRSSHVLVVALFLLQFGCIFPVPFSLKGPPKTWEWEFYQKPPAERLASLDEYSPDQQIDLYLYAVLRMHPGSHYLADPLASSPSWRKYLLPIQGRLQMSLEDDELFELISLLSHFTLAFGHDLRKEEGLWTAIERAVDWLSAPYENRVGWYVDAIRAGPMKP